MKKILLITLLTISVLVHAQERLGIVACGGKFESNVSVYQDRATIGTINLVTKKYTVFDTIHVESVQKVALSERIEGLVFLAAQDSILQYQYNNTSKSFDKINQIPFSGIKTIEANPNYLVAGKWYGGGEYLVVYDAPSLTKLFSSTSITTQIEDIEFIQDSLVAVSYNLKGSIDACAPWGCYSDSLGRIDIINLETGITKKTIDLGLKGLGKISLSAPNLQETLYSISSQNKYICAFDKNFNLIADSLMFGLKDLVSTNNSSTSNLYYNPNLIFGLNSKDSISSAFLNSSTNKFEIVKENIHSTGNKEVYTPYEGFFALNTDFDTFGQVVVQGFASKSSYDTIQVGISPESMVVGEFGPMGVYSSMDESNSNNSIFAIDISKTDYTDLKLYNLNGVQISRSDISTDLDLSSLTNGIYILTAMDTQSNPLKIKVVK